MTILVEICRLSKCYLGKHVRDDCLLTAPAGSSLILARLRRVRSKPVTVLPILATTERELAICEVDVKMNT
jgi:hypothetical protein